jgi:hypothetical protein
LCISLSVQHNSGTLLWWWWWWGGGLILRNSRETQACSEPIFNRQDKRTLTFGGMVMNRGNQKPLPPKLNISYFDVSDLIHSTTISLLGKECLLITSGRDGGEKKKNLYPAGNQTLDIRLTDKLLHEIIPALDFVWKAKEKRSSSFNKFYFVSSVS